MSNSTNIFDDDDVMIIEDDSDEDNCTEYLAGSSSGDQKPLAMSSRKYTSEAFENALSDVQLYKLTVKQASDKYGVPMTTLYDHLRGISSSNQRGPHTQLTPEEEDIIVNCIVDMAKQGLPMTRPLIRCCVIEIVKRSGRSSLFNMERGPSDEWFRKFYKRHPELSEQKVENQDKSKMKMSDPKISAEYFTHLEKILAENGLSDTPSQVDSEGGVECRNPWHEKWGGCDTQLKYPSQIPKMAQFIFQLLGYEPGQGKYKKRSRFCGTCISRANNLTVDEFKDLEAQAKQKWENQYITDENKGTGTHVKSFISRRQSENTHIQTQLEKLDKLDISDDEKAKQAKQLRMLAFVNPGRFMDDFDPERSAREMKKMNRRLYKEKNVRKNQLYDEQGLLLTTKNDLCDCLDVECPGCHFPCPKCSSEKCGGDCRCNRKWVYEYVESEGTGNTYSWPPEVK